jgi:hypothetical protein
MPRDVTGIIFGIVCFVIGAVLLHDGVSGRDPMQAETIAGAAVLSFGAVTLGLVLRDRLKWKRDLREYREE